MEKVRSQRDSALERDPSVLSWLALKMKGLTWAKPENIFKLANNEITVGWASISLSARSPWGKKHWSKTWEKEVDGCMFPQCHCFTRVSVQLSRKQIWGVRIITEKARLLRLSEKEAGQGRKNLRLKPDLTRLEPGWCGTWKQRWVMKESHIGQKT